MADSWDGEDGFTHSMGDGCDPPHTLPESEDGECLSSNDSPAFYSDNAGSPTASTSEATAESTAGAHLDLNTLKRAEEEARREETRAINEYITARLDPSTELAEINRLLMRLDETLPAYVSAVEQRVRVEMAGALREARLALDLVRGSPLLADAKDVAETGLVAINALVPEEPRT